MRLVTLSALFVVGLFSACSKDQPEPLVPAAGTVEAVEKAVEEMATARCDHEQRCNKIGPAKDYSDREHCMSVMREDARKELSDCRSGIDQSDLRQCLTEIQNESCNGVFSGIAEFKACGMDDLCD